MGRRSKRAFRPGAELTTPLYDRSQAAERALRILIARRVACRPTRSSFRDRSASSHGVVPYHGALRTSLPSPGGSGASWQFHNTTGVYPSTCAGFYAAKVKIKATQIFSHHPWTSKVVGVALAWYRPSQPDLLFRSGDPQGWVEASGTESDVDDKGWEYCPPGSLIVGVNSYGIDFVNGLGFACKDLQTGQITFLPGGGINDGPFQDHGCDLNRAVMWNDIQPGLARTGVILDGISFNCGRPSGNTVFWLQ